MRRQNRTLSIADRFAFHVQRCGSDECWPWLGQKTKDGYGMFSRDGHRVRAHRVAYEFAFGVFDFTLCVCHKCDNTECVNPSHLFLGTNQENVSDRNRKGRQATGVHHPKARLRPEQVVEIRQSLLSSRKLAALYGVSHASILLARKGFTWKCVA